MQLIFEDKHGRITKGREKVTFSSFSSYHFIAITARAKSEKQLGKNATDDEDLTVQIDDKTFPILNSDRLKDFPAAFSGGRLHNLAKTVYFLTFLKGRNHAVILETDAKPNTAALESLQVYTLNLLDETLTLEVNQQAEDGDRRPWLTFVLDQLPLKSITPTLTYSRRKRDSDDVKVIIDDKIQVNLLRNIKHFLWRFVGSFLPPFSSKTEAETFAVNLPLGLHYIELDADRKPTLENVTFNFGEEIPIPEGTPTVDNPKWTEDFYDDTEDILLARLIFGEAENQLREAKIGVGYTVINRVKRGNPRWGLNNREVILKESQYDALWNPDRRDAVREPLRGANETTREAWNESYAVATGILDSSLKDPTGGATHFHSYPKNEPKKFPLWATKKNFKIKIGDISFYELER